LQFSRPAQQSSRVDLIEVLDGALMFCRHRFNTMQLSVDKQFPAAGTAYVNGHRSELGQVFLNLFVNALDAMETKGPGPHRLTLKLQRNGTSVSATVGDTGT